jgi:hypothetical protein
VEPVETAFREDADAGAAELAYWLGFAGGARILVSGFGYVHRVVEGVWVEDADEDKRRAQLLGRGRGDTVEARMRADGRDRERGLGVLGDD